MSFPPCVGAAKDQTQPYPSCSTYGLWSDLHNFLGSSLAPWVGEDALRFVCAREMPWEWLVGMPLLCFPIPTAFFCFLLFQGPEGKPGKQGEKGKPGQKVGTSLFENITVRKGFSLPLLVSDIFLQEKFCPTLMPVPFLCRAAKATRGSSARWDPQGSRGQRGTKALKDPEVPWDRW